MQLKVHEKALACRASRRIEMPTLCKRTTTTFPAIGAREDERAEEVGANAKRAQERSDHRRPCWNASHRKRSLVDVALD